LNYRSRSQRSILYHWRDPHFNLLDRNTDINVWEEMPQLDEPSQNLSEGEEGMSVESVFSGDMRQDGGWCVI